METVKELWITRDAYGKLTMFTEEPYTADKEWYSNSGESFEISEEVVSQEITYENSPKRVKLTF